MGISYFKSDIFIPVPKLFWRWNAQWFN